MTPEEQYARQQAKLHQDAPASGEEDDLHIEIPRMPEVNPEIYRDVEPLLFRGFLYAPATINGVSFVFKSLNHHEFEQLSFLDFDKTRRGLKRAYDLFLSYGVLMVDGSNVLPDRDNWLPEIADFFGKLDDGARRTAINRLSEINRRANRAVILTEAYTTEIHSRLRWAQVRGLDLMSTAVTGFTGTDRLGMNWAQLTWRAVNHMEDLKEGAEREWENAKFVASAMAGKGMSKVHSQDRQRRKREAEERAERKDRILRFALLGEPLDKASKGGAAITVARTVEELASQLEKDLKGEKDWHDMVVAETERRVQEQAQARRDQIRKFQEQASERYGDRAVVGTTDLAGLSPEEVQFRLQRRRQLAAQRLAQQVSYPELHDEKAAKFMDRWTQVMPDPKKDDLAISVPDRIRGLPLKKDEG